MSGKGRQGLLQALEAQSLAGSSSEHGECICAGHKALALFFEGFAPVNVVTHAGSEQVVPVHGECSPQKRVKFKVALSLSHSLLWLAVTSCCLCLLVWV